MLIIDSLATFANQIFVYIQFMILFKNVVADLLLVGPQMQMIAVFFFFFFQELRIQDKRISLSLL